MDFLKIRGARVHNLKNVNLDIPKNKLVVFTGVSGSGKSSLAFDTIYAEGQRRYVESLSSYARQFLGVMEKPDVDLIEGLSPSISIDQKSASSNPRSTVGTVTEIYDYLRLLFARVGVPHCPSCGRQVHKLSSEEIAKQLFAKIQTSLENDKQAPIRIMIMSPVVRARKGEFKELFDNLLAKGYERARIDGYYHHLDEDLFILKNNKHSIDLIVDRLTIDYQYFKKEKAQADIFSRLFKAVEQSTLLSEGLVIGALVKDAGFTFPDSPKEIEETLYSQRLSCPHCNLAIVEIEPRLFSFNSPLGACPRCKGLGVVLKVDQDKLVNKSLSIAEGAIFPFQKLFFQDTWFARLFRTMLEKYQINAQQPLNKRTKSQETVLFTGAKEVFSVRGRNREGELTTIYEKWQGLIAAIETKYYEADSDYSRLDLAKYMHEQLCPECRGARLKPEALAVTLNQQNIDWFTRLNLGEALAFLKQLPEKLTVREQQIASSILKELIVRLQFLLNVGLDYLTLYRKANTLSGGEAQRIRLASQIGTGLTGITYVLDEPSIGLHARDISRLLTALIKMRDLENTVIVVEHDWETIKQADWLVDFGPLAGKQGGKIVFSGPQEKIVDVKESLTGQYLTKSKIIPTVRNQAVPDRFLTFKGCTQNNLKNIDVKIPLGRMVGITGVSGGGKSSLLLDTIYTVTESQLNPYYQGKIGQLANFSGLDQIQRVVLVDQSPIGRTPRSNPATYTGCFTYIRELFSELPEAKIKNFNPSHFSFNIVGGRCEVCSGDGFERIDMQFLSDVYVKCKVCDGTRYQKEILDVCYKEKNIAGVLDMAVVEAKEFFRGEEQILQKLNILDEVGLGYIKLGQSATTLSGGEAQRVKLATELSRRDTGRTLYILDEPTTGLHFDDIKRLLSILQKLVDKGNTVLLIEHNLDVIKSVDWVIDLGPEGGDKGGRVVACGTPSEVAKVKESYTGQYLKKILK